MNGIGRMATQILDDEQAIRELSRTLRQKKGELAKAVFDQIGPESAIESGAFTINVRQINRMFRH